MAQISEIIQIEQERTLDSCNVIHLFQEGSFIRAYEWSAWLCVQSLGKFKVTKRKYKNIDPLVAFIGFPVTSFGKYIGDKFVVNNIDENRRDIQLTMEVTSFEELQTEFEEWKTTLPVAEPSEKKNAVSGNTLNSGVTITGVMRKILAFPLENSTPMQSMAFIAEVKQELSQVI